MGNAPGLRGRLNGRHSRWLSGLTIRVLHLASPAATSQMAASLSTFTITGSSHMDRSPSRPASFRLPLAVPPSLQRPGLARHSSAGPSPTRDQRTPVMPGPGGWPRRTPLNARFSQQQTRFDVPLTPRRPRPLPWVGGTMTTTSRTGGSSARGVRRSVPGSHMTPGSVGRPPTAYTPGTAAPTYNEDSGLYTVTVFEAPNPVQRDVGIAAMNMVTGMCLSPACAPHAAPPHRV